MEKERSSHSDLANLIRLADSGDGSAWEQLLGPLQKPIFQFLCRRISVADAYDVLQSTFLTVFRKLDQCQSPEKFSSWVFQIAYRQMLNFLRKSNHPIQNTTELDFDPQSRASSNEDSQIQQRVDDLRRAVDFLPDQVREVVWLRLKEEMSFKEIAEITGAPIGTVLGRMQQGKKRLKELLSDASIDP